LRATKFAKTHHEIVDSLETVIPTVSLLSMLPCILIIAKTGTLHWNCKMLLLCSATVQLLMITIHLMLIIYEVHKGDHLPDDVGNDAWFMFAHEIGYGVTTIVSIYLVVERYVS
ncbi:hypothetical protein PMAYCL1PPCAC_33130, partial [Pristionchus mayeri]